jgi:hypothetical protein
MGFGDAMRCVSLPFIIDDRSPPLDPIYLQGGKGMPRGPTCHSRCAASDTSGGLSPSPFPDPGLDSVVCNHEWIRSVDVGAWLAGLALTFFLK